MTDGTDPVTRAFGGLSGADLGPTVHAPTRARLTTRPRRSAMPLTGVFLALYILALVLLSENASTVMIALGLGFLLAAVFVVEVIRRRCGFVLPAPLAWFAIFLCYSTFQMIYVPGSTSTLLTLYQLLVFSVVVVNYGVLAGDAARFDWAMYAAVIMTFIYNLVADPPVVDGRIGSTIGNPNGYALVLMIGLLLSFRRFILSGTGRSLKSGPVAAFVLYFALSIYGIVYLAGSRKGIVLTLVASVVLILYWLWQQPFQRRTWISFAVLAVFACLGYVLYESPQFTRIVELSSLLGGGNTADTSLLIRDQMLSDGFRTWLQRPLTGFGLDQFRVVTGWRTYSHDNYVELLVNSGLIGLLTYLMIYVSAFVSLVRSLVVSKDRRVAADAFWALTVLGVLAVWDFGAVSYSEKFNWLLLSAVIAVSVRAKMASREPAHGWAADGGAPALVPKG